MSECYDEALSIIRNQFGGKNGISICLQVYFFHLHAALSSSSLYCVRVCCLSRHILAYLAIFKVYNLVLHCRSSQATATVTGSLGLYCAAMHVFGFYGFWQSNSLSSV
jgi:hypothetical protein